VLGNNATFNNPYLPSPTVTFMGGPGVYTFTLVITDSSGNTGTAGVSVTYTGS
jgi:hypothetical protein